MSFLLKESNTGRHWRTFFDYVLVDACKPLFFAEGTSMKEVDSVSWFYLFSFMNWKFKFYFVPLKKTESRNQKVWQPLRPTEGEQDLFGRQLRRLLQTDRLARQRRAVRGRSHIRRHHQVQEGASVAHISCGARACPGNGRLVREPQSFYRDRPTRQVLIREAYVSNVNLNSHHLNDVIYSEISI